MKVSLNIRASLYMMLSMLGFVCNDLIIKSLDGRIPNSQVMLLRGLFLAFLIFALAWQQGVLKKWRTMLKRQVMLRSLLEALATVFFLAALVKMPYANIAAILMFLPLAVTIGAALVLNEPIGWRRWLAIVVGLGGVMLIIRPGVADFNVASIFILISVVFAAMRDLTTRTLPEELPTLLVAANAAITISTLGLVLTILQGSWLFPSTTQWASLGSAAFFLFFGYHFVILSMRTGEVAYVVPFRYSVMLWAILLGFLFFGELPDWQTLVGSAVVITMGLYTLYRELKLARFQS